MEIVEANGIEFPLQQNPKIFKTLVDNKHQLIMGELKAALLAKLNPNNLKPNSNQLKSYIEQQLNQLFPSFSTPSHLPYASMIHGAITELNDEEGSSTDEISSFIKREYMNLPRGHESYLSHHLRKLCVERAIKCINGGRYVQLVKYSDLKEIPESTKKKRGRRGKRRRGQGRAKKAETENKPEMQQVGNIDRIRELETSLTEMAEIKTNASEKQKKPKLTIKFVNSSDKRYNHVMESLKDSVVEHLAAKSLSNTIEPELRTLIEQRCKKLFNNFDTPTHPPYAFMIQKAILEMNQEGWLNEEAISSFIKKEFKGLPFGHESFLHLCLKKLCKNRNLVFGNDGQYRLPDRKCDFKDPKRRGIKKQWHRQIGGEDGQVEEQMADEIPGGTEEQLNLLDKKHEAERQMAEMTKQQIVPWSQERQHEQRGLVCALSAQQHYQPRISGKKLAAKSDRVQISTSPKLCVDTGRDLQLSSLDVNKSTAVSTQEYSLHQLEKQLPKHKRQGRSLKRKRDEGMITESELLSNGRGGNEQRLMLECQGNVRRSRRTSVIYTTPALSLCSNDQNHKRAVATAFSKRGRPLKRKRYEDMITDSKGPSNGHGRKEQQLQLECEGNVRRSRRTSVIDTTPVLPICSKDQNHKRAAAAASSKLGRPKIRT
ncbi:uncharacterized protein LOC126682805 [Mercurialis annua]|uniref:uncharacterized protein LOC126682805 n=1 Tax=Mercurialis annua TaxID=3986 RepID=UPI00215DE6F0|nr:uncharacterized protein LOC126682805 [Mercurialis annua]